MRVLPVLQYNCSMSLFGFGEHHVALANNNIKWWTGVISVLAPWCCIATPLSSQVSPSIYKQREESHNTTIRIQQIFRRDEEPNETSRGRLFNFPQGSRLGIHFTFRTHESAICANPQEQSPKTSTAVFNINIIRCRRRRRINTIFVVHSSPPRSADFFFHGRCSKIKKGARVLEVEPPIVHDAARSVAVGTNCCPVRTLKSLQWTWPRCSAGSWSRWPTIVTT